MGRGERAQRFRGVRAAVGGVLEGAALHREAASGARSCVETVIDHAAGITDGQGAPPAQGNQSGATDAARTRRARAYGDDTAVHGDGADETSVRAVDEHGASLGVHGIESHEAGDGRIERIRAAEGDSAAAGKGGAERTDDAPGDAQGGPGAGANRGGGREGDEPADRVRTVVGLKGAQRTDTGAVQGERLGDGDGVELQRGSHGIGDHGVARSRCGAESGVVADAQRTLIDRDDTRVAGLRLGEDEGARIILLQGGAGGERGVNRTV